MNPSKLPNWSGETAVILASGPSLTLDQVALVEQANVKTIATNSTWRIADVDVLFAVDYLFFKVCLPEFKAAKRRAAVWTQDRSAADRWGLNWVRQDSRPGLGNPGLRTNGNSGMGAINLAYLFGARRILLVGMDMKLGPKGEKHHHPDHPKPLVQGLVFTDWLHKARDLAKGLKAEKVEVINCTPGSALQCFPMGDLEKELLK